ncbi:MAG: hypothetical protein NT029_03175 [Armatimonadetes bacterium]|nr:hypothetical protein [Armatimonadota bacterium]
MLSTGSHWLCVTDVPPGISYYTDAGYLVAARAVAIGPPLWVQVNAPEANLDSNRADQIEVRITSKLTGDVETSVAVETGPSSGIFRVSPPLPTAVGEMGRVSPQNGTMETARRDSLTATSRMAGGATLTALVTVDPWGIVFDARTGEPVSGAAVSLIDVTGQGNGGRPGEAALVFDLDGATELPATATTGATGAYRFPLVAPGSYRLAVVPPAAYKWPSLLAVANVHPGFTVDADGSYGRPFAVEGGLGSFIVDLPADGPAPWGLALEKMPSRPVAEIADYVDYQLRLRNLTGVPLTGIQITDSLPPGFAYQRGTTRIGATGVPQAAAAEPEGGAGPSLRFSIGDLAIGKDAVVRYRVRIGPGARIGANTNRAQAAGASIYGTSTSSIASATVKVEGGVFSDRGVLVGKVFVDTNGNRTQDAGEPGVPGVRVYLEDGTFSVTDGEGKYSLYGLIPRSHVVRLDPATLPSGAVMVPVGNRHAKSGMSAFADLKSGELHRTNFCMRADSAVTKEVEARRRGARALPGETEAGLKEKISPDGQPAALGDDRARPHQGLVGREGGPAPLLPALGAPKRASEVSSLPAAPVQAAPPVPMESLLPAADNRLGFLTLRDKDTLPIAQANVAVKGPVGSQFALTVNGTVIGPDRVGKKSTLASKGIEAWEFIGVNLMPGPNRLTLGANDSPEGAVTITVIAPGSAARLDVAPAAGPRSADGQTPLAVTVRIADSGKVPVTTRTLITLECSAGTWQGEDLDPKEPGMQTFIEGGEARYMLIPPDRPGDVDLRVTSGALHGEASVGFGAALRPLMAVGMVEANLQFRGGDRAGWLSLDGQSPFERELRNFSLSGSDGRVQAGARAAVFARGAIGGKYALTLGYDSEKSGEEALFRDIQPDLFYPVYGDSATKGFEAQTTGSLYLRVDRERSFVQYGDFVTPSSTESRSLAAYYRSMTGFSQHLEMGKLALDGFASHDSLRQVVDEFRGNGTSGPFRLTNRGLAPNSERVEILVRDRSQSAVVLKTSYQSRFIDYELEASSGNILFRRPVPSVDSALNPVWIRVSYEVEQAGPRFWLTGLTGSYRLGRKAEVGATWVRDSNPLETFSLLGLNSTLRLGQNTILYAEAAQTDHLTDGAGKGARVEVIHETAKVKGRLFVGSTQKAFHNPTSTLSQGRSEMSLKGAMRLTGKSRIVAEAIHSEDVSSMGKRTGVQVGLEQTLRGGSTLELAVRHASETSAPAESATVTADRIAFTSLRARLTGQAPHLRGLSLYGEYESDLGDSAKRVLALGGDYPIANRGKLYLRHELLSSLAGRYALNTDQTEQTTVLGIDTDYMRDGHLFSEYRARDAFSGREVEAAMGLRNQWAVAKGIRLQTGLERVKSLGGSAGNSTLSVTSAVEYTRDPLLKGTARVEWQDSPSTSGWLTSIGAARKASRDWTFLGRNLLSIENGKGNSGIGRTRERFQLGAAYRQSGTDKWSGLARYEYRYQNEDATAGALAFDHAAHVASLDLNCQAAEKLTVSAKYAFKIARDMTSGLATRSTAHLLGSRITADLSSRWDAGFLVNVLMGGGASRYGVGAEVGYLLDRDLWLSAGYNLLGYQDDDLAAGEYTSRGAFIRVRMKFDEGLFGAGNRRGAER